MDDLSQAFVQTKPLDSIRYIMKKCAACQLSKFTQIDLARLLYKPHEVKYTAASTVQDVLQLSVSAAYTCSGMRMQDHTVIYNLCSAGIG